MDINEIAPLFSVTELTQFRHDDLVNFAHSQNLKLRMILKSIAELNKDSMSVMARSIVEYLEDTIKQTETTDSLLETKPSVTSISVSDIRRILDEYKNGINYEKILDMVNTVVRAYKEGKRVLIVTDSISVLDTLSTNLVFRDDIVYEDIETITDKDSTSDRCRILRDVKIVVSTITIMEQGCDILSGFDSIFQLGVGWKSYRKLMYTWNIQRKVK